MVADRSADMALSMLGLCLALCPHFAMLSLRWVEGSELCSGRQTGKWRQFQCRNDRSELHRSKARASSKATGGELF